MDLHHKNGQLLPTFYQVYQKFTIFKADQHVINSSSITWVMCPLGAALFWNHLCLEFQIQYIKIGTFDSNFISQTNFGILNFWKSRSSCYNAATINGTDLRTRTLRDMSSGHEFGHGHNFETWVRNRFWSEKRTRTKVVSRIYPNIWHAIYII